MNLKNLAIQSVVSIVFYIAVIQLHVLFFAFKPDLYQSFVFVVTGMIISKIQQKWSIRK